MKVYICADIEGVAGVTSWEQTLPGNPEYERARRLMTGEVNAAIEGAFAGGATEVVVADSHYRFTNLIAEQLDPRAVLMQGRPRPGVMCPGLDASYSALLFVGHHAGVGHEGVLAHSFSHSAISRLSLGAVECAEVTLHGAQAGALGIPVALLTGDDIFMAQCAPLFRGTRRAQVKHALGARAAASLSPTRAQEVIRREAELALLDLSDMQAFTLPLPAPLSFEFADAAMADLVALIPVARRHSARVVSLDCADMDAVLGWLMVVLTLAGSIR